ncbi:MAG: hypothetical protein KJ571_17995 [Bacteroidetes bacterium]|nr:hypothetical protein [Bacteroidota bacterium]
MPLKNPKSIPKIPKTRKKKALSAIDLIPQPKPDKIEYVCKTYFKYEMPTKKQYCVIAVETVTAFANFAYEISIEWLRDKREINILLAGLKAKTNMVPMVQPAKKEIFFEDLVGEYIINIIKQDGAINTGVFKFNIFNKEIKLIKNFKPKKKNNRFFCEFKVEEEEFNFN